MHSKLLYKGHSHTHIHAYTGDILKVNLGHLIGPNFGQLSVQNFRQPGESIGIIHRVFFRLLSVKSSFFTLLGSSSRTCLQRIDTVGWASGRASGPQKVSDEVLVWLSIRSEVLIVCM